MPVNYVLPITMTSKDSATIAGGYNVVNTGLTSACFMLRVVNDSNADIIVSFDGATDNDYIIAGETLQIYA